MALVATTLDFGFIAGRYLLFFSYLLFYFYVVRVLYCYLSQSVSIHNLDHYAILYTHSFAAGIYIWYVVCM